MANTKQAAKRAKQNIKQAAHNTSLRSRMRTFVKKTRKLVDEKNPEAARTMMSTAISQLDKMVNKKLVHRNKAARLKSRLVKRVKTLQEA